MTGVAVAQMVSSASVQDNLSTVDKLLKQAQKSQAQLVVLPENFAFMGLQENDKFKVAEVYGEGPIQQTVSQLAHQYGIWIIAGSIPLRGKGERLSSSCLVYNDKGDCVARYNKMHLFDVCVSEQETYHESLTVEPGKEIVVVDTPVGRVGLSVCYDLRFPELYRRLVLKGAELLVVPSAFTAVTGKAHWEVLLRARAIENLCYVLAANQGGHHENGRQSYGHSMIVEPWGKILGMHEQDTGIVNACVDLQRLRHLRQQFPCNEHHIL